MANRDLSRYQYDPGLLAQFTQTARPALLDFVKQQNRWGGSPNRSADDIINRISNQELKAYSVPKDIYKNLRGESSLSSGGFHSGDNIYLKGLYGID